MMSNYENGREPPYEVLLQYMRRFGVSADYLLGVTDEKQPVTDDVARRVSAVRRAAVRAGASSAVTASDLLALVEAFRAYYAAGAPSGNAPMESCVSYLAGLTRALDAARAEDPAALLTAVNDAVSGALTLPAVLTGRPAPLAP